MSGPCRCRHYRRAVFGRRSAWGPLSRDVGERDVAVSAVDGNGGRRSEVLNRCRVERSQMRGGRSATIPLKADLLRRYAYLRTYYERFTTPPRDRTYDQSTEERS